MGHPKGRKGDFDALQRRRMEALQLFREGIPQATIARQLKAARALRRRVSLRLRIEAECSRVPVGLLEAA